MGKGNGDDKSVQDAKNQMAFLAEVKELAAKHGIQIAGSQAGLEPLRQSRNLRIQVITRGDQIVVDFGQSVSWMAMNMTQATKFAATIIKQVQDFQSIGAAGGEGEAPAVDETEQPDPDTEKVDKSE